LVHTYGVDPEKGCQRLKVWAARAGTGLTHLGSAAGRDKMHAKVEGQENLTDSMKMFNMGLEGGKPEEGHGVRRRPPAPSCRDSS
jgi:hypothetical protein